MNKNPEPIALGITRFICECKKEILDIDKSPHTNYKGKNCIYCTKCGKQYEINGELKKELSKYKKIYHIYMSNDGDIHLEKYPIIYSNIKYIYFKKGSDEELSKIDFSNCYLNIQSIIVKVNNLIEDRNMNSYYNFSYWFLIDNSTEEEKKQFFDKLKTLKSLINQFVKSKEIKEYLDKMLQLKDNMEKINNRVSSQIDIYRSLYDYDPYIEDIIKDYNKKVNKKGEENYEGN